MSSLKSIGQLIRVPIEQVELTEGYEVPAYQVGVLAEKLQHADVRNWVPVIVQEPTLRRFQVVGNGHILDAMKAAGQEYVWVAVIPEDPQIEEQVNFLTGKSPLRINLCTASYEIILEGLRHLRDTPANKLETLNITLVAERILKESGRFTWTSLQPLSKLGFKSITSAKLKVFAEIFEAKPEPIEIEPVVLNTASEHELLEVLQAATTLPEVNLGTTDIKQLAKAIAADSSRKYWGDLKALTKIKPGLKPQQLQGLDTIFILEPAEFQPVSLNTASEIQLLEALQAATALPEVNLGTTDIKQLAKAIATDPERKYWQDLNALTKIKPSVSKGKLGGLEQAFNFTPEPAPEPNTVRYLLDLMSLTELKNEARKREVSIPKSTKKADLVDILCKST